MSEHFESLWEQAEQLQDIELDISINDIEECLSAVQKCDVDMREYHMGLLIFNLCNISKKLNINTYVALQKTITDKKSEKLEYVRT
jgi:hypothetical protein